MGPKELKLLEESGFRRWRPRLPEQPIFYPVTNESYAIEIASRWNVKDDGVGYVTRFAVRADFMQRYEVQKRAASHRVVGAWLRAGAARWLGREIPRDRG